MSDATEALDDKARIGLSKLSLLEADEKEMGIAFDTLYEIGTVGLWYNNKALREGDPNDDGAIDEDRCDFAENKKGEEDLDGFVFIEASSIEVLFDSKQLCIIGDSGNEDDFMLLDFGEHGKLWALCKGELGGRY